MIRVYVEPSGRRIQPFGDPSAEALILNRPLAAWQEEMITDGGFSRVASLEPPCLVVPDTLFSTGATLRRFVERAEGRDAVLVLADSLFGRRTTPVQPHVEAVASGWRFDKIRFVSGREAAPVEVLIDPEEQVRQINLPTRFTASDEVEFAMPRFPVMTLHHWVHILWANQVAGLVQMRNMPRLRMVVSGIRAAARALSLNRWKILARCNRIGRGCDIHPTAVVEISSLGRGVTVSAHARVLASTIGDGAMIGAGAQVEGSTVGERALVTQAACLRFCVLYPESVASHALMQRSILGRRAVTTLGSGAIDLNFEREIQVVLDGRLHATGSTFLGSAFGHDCRIGTGIYIAAGREIPNGYFLVRDPGQVLRQVPEGLQDSGPLMNDGGTLRPVRAPRPPWPPG